MDASGIGWWGVPLAVAAGAVRAGTPFLFVSLGELITEKSGRINLGLEGTLVMGAMSGYGTAYLTGSPWLGVLVAGIVGSLFGAVHAGLCSLPRVIHISEGHVCFRYLHQYVRILWSEAQCFRILFLCSRSIPLHGQ
jgi:simple sugar transport system permease protein